MHFELKGTILFCVKKLSEHALSLAHVCSDGVMGRAVQIHPVTRSTRKTDRNRPESGRPDCSGGSAADLHHQKPIPADRLRFRSEERRVGKEC